jgi:hypothetical protein
MAMSMIVNTPAAPLTLPAEPAQLLPSDQNGVHKTTAQSRQAPNHAAAAAAAFAEHVEPADDAEIEFQPVDHVDMPGSNAIEGSEACTEIDVMAVLGRIATEWEKSGVNPAWIKVIKDSGTWQILPELDVLPSGLPAGLSVDQRSALLKVANNPITRTVYKVFTNDDLPAIGKLREELERSGEFTQLCSQAIRIMRGTQAWQELLDNGTVQEPGVPRWKLDHYAVATLFGSGNDTSLASALVVYRIVIARAIANQENLGPARQPSHAGQPATAIAV